MFAPTITPNSGPSPPKVALADLETERLEAEIASLYSRLSAETCRWLELVAELDRRDAYKRWGCRTCADWLSWHCGIAIRAGQEQVRVARRLAEMPKVVAAFRRGELSYSKVRALARIVEPESEESLLDLARNATAAQLERTASAYRRSSAEGDEATIHDKRFCDIRVEDDGCVNVRARLAPEEGALLKLALEHAREELWRERDDDCVRSEMTRQAAPLRPIGTSRADALVRVAESALASGDAARTGGDATQVVIHVEPEAIDGRPLSSARPRCEIEDGSGISSRTVERMACDCSKVVIKECGGSPLSVGRKTRSVPPAIRRAMKARDGGTCAFPGCNARRFIDAHHITHWAHGGKTELKNLVPLCRHHHRLVHEGGFSVRRRGSGSSCSFHRPDGSEIPAAPALPGLTGAGGRSRPRVGAPDWVDPRGNPGPDERLRPAPWLSGPQSRPDAPLPAQPTEPKAEGAVGRTVRLRCAGPHSAQAITVHAPVDEPEP